MSEEKKQETKEKAEKQEEKKEEKKNAEAKEQPKAEAKAEKKAEEAKEEKKPAKGKVKSEEEAEEKVAAPPKPQKAKRVKVTSMTLEQVEEGLANAEKHMGGFNSRHAKSLLARRNFLAKYSGKRGADTAKAA